MEAIRLFLQILFVFNILFFFTVVFFEKKNPSVTWAWLMLVLLVPYVGFVIYLLVGLDSRKHRRFAVKAKEDEALFKQFLAAGIDGLILHRNQTAGEGSASFLKVDGAEHLDDLAHLNLCSGGGTYTKHNGIALFHDGVSKFERMREDFGAAKEFIHVLYYIMRGDDIGRAIIGDLARKAEQGVEVKLLVDGMGSWRTPEKFYEPLVKAGGQVAIFWPPHFGRMNFRNHRKICVIDGVIGYVGGFNIGDEYLGRSKRFGFWRDTHVRITGDAVKDLEARFIMDWNFSAPKRRIETDSRYFPVAAHAGGELPIQIVSSGPDTKWPAIYFGYCKMITEANKNIYIQTPYFVPDDNIFESLRISALSGIDVRIVIPANPDHLFVYWASLSYLGELLKAGVRCYEYKEGFLHSKLLVVDGIVSSCGTANMDVRSFKLNFEINAFIYDRTTCKTFEEKFLADLGVCTEITLESYNARGGITKFKEAISRLLSPLL